MANGNCQCNGVVGNLISHITPYLQALNIFDVQNVFVCCLDLQIANNRIRILNSRNPSCINSSGQPFGFNQIVSSAGVYVVVGNSCKLGCDNRSNIIYIGSTGNLQDRIREFIRTLRSERQLTGQNTPVHIGAGKIGRALLSKDISQTCLYIIGFPIQSQVQNQYQGIWEKAEGCFLVIYTCQYCDLPCFVDKIEAVDFTIFGFGIPPAKAKQEIEKLLKDIDSTFQSCIRNC